MNSQSVRVAEIAERRASEEFNRRYQSRVDRASAGDALDEFSIAELPDQAIAGMNREELVRLICAADLPLPSGFDADRLRLQDRSALERLAYLSRRACHNRVTILSCRFGSDEP